MLIPDDTVQLDPPDGDPIFMLRDQDAEFSDDFIQPDAPEHFAQ